MGLAAGSSRPRGFAHALRTRAGLAVLLDIAVKEDRTGVGIDERGTVEHVDREGVPTASWLSVVPDRDVERHGDAPRVAVTTDRGLARDAVVHAHNRRALHAERHTVVVEDHVAPPRPVWLNPADDSEIRVRVQVVADDRSTPGPEAPTRRRARLAIDHRVCDAEHDVGEYLLGDGVARGHVQADGDAMERVGSERGGAACGTAGNVP